MADLFSILIICILLLLIVAGILIWNDKRIFKLLNKKYKPENDLTRKESKREGSVKPRGDGWDQDQIVLDRRPAEVGVKELLSSESSNFGREESNGSGESRETTRRFPKLVFKPRRRE